MADDLRFPSHVQQRMRQRQIPEARIYHVVRDPDEILERDDGRTEYVSRWERRVIRAVIEEDGLTVVTVVEMRKGRSMR